MISDQNGRQIALNCPVYLANYMGKIGQMRAKLSIYGALTKIPENAAIDRI